MRTRRAPVPLLAAAACLVAFASGPTETVPAASAALPGKASQLLATPAVAGPGTEAPASAIPWEAVGPGWFVALWGPHSDEGSPPPAGWQRQKSTLYLVDPSGGRYRVASLPAPSFYTLLDWSGDGRRVLLRTPPQGNSQHYEIEDLDLASGQVLHEFAGSSSVTAYQYTRPDGLALLASSGGEGQPGPAKIVRLTLSGATELAYPSTFPGVGALSPGFLGGSEVLPSLDGTEIVIPAARGLALVANDGTFVRGLGPSGQYCSPDRWWDATDFIASCQPAGNVGGVLALWLIPVSGGPPARLTQPRPPDLGDVDGWRVGSSVYTQALGPCGTQFLARRLPNGRTAPVAVPGAQDDVHVVGADGNRLALSAMFGCGPGKSLFWYNPTTGRETPLLGPPLNGGSVLEALPYPGIEP